MEEIKKEKFNSKKEILALKKEVAELKEMLKVKPKREKVIVTSNPITNY